MKSKSLLSSVLAFAVFSQLSLSVFAADANQEFFDKSLDKALNSKHDTAVCNLSVPTFRIDPKLASILSNEEKEADKLNMVALKNYKKWTKTVYNELAAMHYYGYKIFDGFPMAALFGENKLTYKQAVAAIGATEEIVDEQMVIGDKVYYNIGKGWNVYTDKAYADEDLKYAGDIPLGSNLESSSFIFEKKGELDGRPVSIYTGVASASTTSLMLEYLLGKDLAAAAKPASAKLFIGEDGYWKKMVYESKFSAYDLLGTIKQECVYDFGNKKLRAPVKAKPVEKDVGGKEMGV